MQAQCRGTGLEEREAGSGLKALGCGLIMHVAIFQHFAGALFGASVCAHYYRGGGPPNMYIYIYREIIFPYSLLRTGKFSRSHMRPGLEQDQTRQAPARSFGSRLSM